MQKYALYVYRNNQVEDRFDIESYDDFTAIKKAERVYAMYADAGFGKLMKGNKQLKKIGGK